MAAVMRVLESWLLFQRGDAKQALDILQAAVLVLNKTDDYLTLGNIHSSYGRIAGRQGRFQHAIDDFTAAIAQYKTVSYTHLFSSYRNRSPIPETQFCLLPLLNMRRRCLRISGGHTFMERSKLLQLLADICRCCSPNRSPRSEDF